LGGWGGGEGVGVGLWVGVGAEVGHLRREVGEPLEVYGRYRGDTREIYLRGEVGEPLEQSVPLGARLQPLGMELELELG